MQVRGINKRKLAQIAGVRTSAVTKWAKGNGIRLDTLSKIAAYFGVDVRELLPYSGDTPKVNTSETTAEVNEWKSRALNAEQELRRYKSAFAKLARSLRNASEVIDEMEGGK